jgi:hypothetical protein
MRAHDVLYIKSASSGKPLRLCGAVTGVCLHTEILSYIISYRILYCVTCICLVCKTYPWSDASTIRQKLYLFYIWKLLYMFRVVPPPIIGSAYNCINSICYLSHRYCYLPLSWWSSNSSTIAAGRSNGVTNTRCCRYSCMRSRWWVAVLLEICRAVFSYI